MDLLTVAIVILLIGGISFSLSLYLFLDEERLRRFIENSKNPQTRMWVNAYGVDRLVVLSKRYFLPMAIFASVLIVSISLWAFYQVYTSQG